MQEERMNISIESREDNIRESMELHIIRETTDEVSDQKERDILTACRNHPHCLPSKSGLLRKRITTSIVKRRGRYIFVLKRLRRKTPGIKE
jgi:hypothetical protein